MDAIGKEKLKLSSKIWLYQLDIEIIGGQVELVGGGLTLHQFRQAQPDIFLIG